MNNVFALRKPTFTFKYHPNLCKQKVQITVHFNFRREFAQSFMDEIFMTFKDQNHFLNYICLNLNTSQTKEQKQHSDWCEIHTLMRRSDWCEIHTLNYLIGASNIPLSTYYDRCYYCYFLITQNYQ